MAYFDIDDTAPTPDSEAENRRRVLAAIASAGKPMVLGQPATSSQPNVPRPRLTPVEPPDMVPTWGGTSSLGGQHSQPVSPLRTPTAPPARLTPTQPPDVGGPTFSGSPLGQPVRPARPDVMPTREDFPAKPEVSGLRKWLGLGLAALSGSQTAGPLAQRILGGQRAEAERRYQQAEQEWERGQAGEERQATLAKTKAETEEALGRAAEARTKATQPTPIDEAKQPIGDAGATQHAQQLETLTGSMTPQQKQQFVAAYGATSTDTHAIATKRLEDAKAAAQLSGSQQDRAVQLQISLRNQREQEADRAERRAQRTEETGAEIWRAVDKNNRVHLISKAEYDANKGNYSSAMKLNPDAIKQANDHATAINEMQARTNAMADAVRGFNWSDSGQKSIVKQVLSHSNDQNYVDQILGIPVAQWTAANVKQWGLEGATPETRDYIIAALSMREASMAMPKEITGGSRQTQQAVSALWNTLPEGATPNSDWAMKQLRTFQSVTDRLKRTRVPSVPGLPEEPVHPALQSTQGGAGGTHNFTVNGVPFENVPDAEYQRARKLKGFKE